MIMKKNYWFILSLVVLMVIGFKWNGFASYIDSIFVTHSVTIIPVTWPTSANSTTLTVANNATTYRSNSFPIDSYVYSAGDYNSNNGGGFKLQFGEGDTVPAVEGNADGNWAVVDNMPDIVSNSVDSAFHIFALSKAAKKRGRFIVTPAGMANNSTIVVNYDGQN
jgi:hypothetical protein